MNLSGNRGRLNSDLSLKEIVLFKAMLHELLHAQCRTWWSLYLSVLDTVCFSAIHISKEMRAF